MSFGTPIGTRVIAIASAKDDTVYSFGEGVLLKSELPPKELGFPLPNPCILLDNGKKVFGIECWWGEKERMEKEIIRGRKIVTVDVDESRAKHSNLE